MTTSIIHLGQLDLPISMISRVNFVVKRALRKPNGEEQPAVTQEAKHLVSREFVGEAGMVGGI